MSTEPNPSKLRWLCRRGSLELDLMLTRYLDLAFQHAPALEQHGFEHLLGLADPKLQRWLIGGEDPDDPDLLTLVRNIRAAAQHRA